MAGIFFKLASIFLKWLPCKMEEFSFLLSQILCSSTFRDKEAKFDTFEFKMAPIFSKWLAFFKMAAPEMSNGEFSFPFSEVFSKSTLLF